MADASRLLMSTLVDDMPIRPGARDAIRVARGERLLRVISVPREMFSNVHEQQCRDNHARSLDEMRIRSGFSAGEAVCVLSRLPRGWTPPEDEAHCVLRGIISAFGRGLHMLRDD